jgi:hypothetical protein
MTCLDAGCLDVQAVQKSAKVETQVFRGETHNFGEWRRRGASAIAE